MTTQILPATLTCLFDNKNREFTTDWINLQKNAKGSRSKAATPTLRHTGKIQTLLGSFKCIKYYLSVRCKDCIYILPNTVSLTAIVKLK